MGSEDGQLCESPIALWAASSSSAWPRAERFWPDLHSVGKRCAGIVLRGCLTEKSLVKIGASSRTTRFASREGSFRQTGSQSGYSARIRGCFERLSHRKIAGENRRVLSHDETRL